MDTLFMISNLVVLPFWLVMILFPRRGLTHRIMRSLWPVVPVPVLYAALVLPQLGALAPVLANPSLAGISAGLATPGAALIGWAHFLAFDLFVGRWAYLDSRERGLSPWLVSPVLLFIFMLGPFGFLLYLLVRTLAKGRSAQAV